MKTSFHPGRVMPKAVMAVCVLSACSFATSSFAQEQYPPYGQKPRVGTRFLNFVKDLVWGEDPDTRYQGHPPVNASRQRSRAPQGGQRYSLDSPPPAAAYDAPPEYQQRPVPPPPSQNHLTQPEQSPRDMPYSTPRQEKTQEPVRNQRREEAPVQEEPPAPVKQKPRVEEHKKVEETPPQPQSQSKGGLFSRKSEPKKEVEESLPESRQGKSETSPLKTTASTPKTSTTKQDPPVETPKETVVASNNAKEKGTGNSASTPPVSNAATLTGTKTTKAGLVKSPYPPFNELDVTGLPTGSLAMDPTTGKVFRVP
jgi:hypothetical protein